MGVFVVPINLMKSGQCFDTYQIGHYRDGEGYSDTWYDKENDNEAMHSFTFDVPASPSSDIYFSVSTYSYEIVPRACTTG